MSHQMISVATTADVRSNGTPGSNTPFFASDKTLPPRTLRLLLTIQCANDSVLTAVIGGVSLVLNDGNAIPAGKTWDCNLGARPGSFNLQIENGGAVQYLAAEIIYGG